MQINSIFDIFGGLLILGLVTDVLSSKNTASDVSAVASAWNQVEKGAMGK